MINNNKDSLIINIENQVCTLILNRPKFHNAFDEHLIQKLTEILKEVNVDDNIKIVVLKAMGKNFSAGADINWMQKMINYSEADNKIDSLKLAELMQVLNELSKPTITLVQGAVYGGAIGLVACCDIVLAQSQAKFCFSEVKIGLIPAVISPYVIQAIGAQAARRYFLTAEVFNAATAKTLGLVHEIVEDLAGAASNLIKTIKQNSPQAITAAKQLILKNLHSNFDQNLINDTAARIAKVRVSKEGQEGLKAFLEKRNPNWIAE